MTKRIREELVELRFILPVSSLKAPMSSTTNFPPACSGTVAGRSGTPEAEEARKCRRRYRERELSARRRWQRRRLGGGGDECR